MQRRNFLKAMGAASALPLVPSGLAATAVKKTKVVKSATIKTGFAKALWLGISKWYGDTYNAQR